MSLMDRIEDPSAEIAIWHPRPEILLCANTVKPLHGVVPREILGRSWWDATRKAAYRLTQNHCMACAVSATYAKELQRLEGHELYEIDYRAGRQYYIETVALCHYCHCFIHDGRMEALVQRGQMDPTKMRAVLTHGSKILKEHKLRKYPYFGKMAEWSRWRLVIDGNEYPPKYASLKEWERAFDPKEDE